LLTFSDESGFFPLEYVKFDEGTEARLALSALIADLAK
jgi:hypothetical protein